jgi:EAL domain-containing protein (putative c-di-GMP-specific phosphodiesterase class I)
MADEYQPNLVFCADRMPAASCRSAIDLLRLLTVGTADIHVVRVGEVSGNGLDLLDEGGVVDDVTAPAPVQSTGDTWRGTLPSLLETSWDAVALSDAAGWITSANINTCAILSGSSPNSLGTILDARYFEQPEFRLHRMAFFNAEDHPTPVHLSDLVEQVCRRATGAYTALPIAALHLPGLRLLTEAFGKGSADVMLDIADTELRAGGINCGLVARLGDDDAIVVLPDLALPSDAAVHVQNERGTTERPVAAERRIAGRRIAGPFGAPEIERRHSERRAVPAAVPMAGAVMNTLLSTAAPAPVRANAAAPDLKPPMADGLDDALRRHAIGVHYQPQFELDSGRGCGVEALARWYLTSGEAVAPTVFIPAAERAGMIDALGARVLKIACEAAATWRDRESQRLTWSVKVSTLQINSGFSRTLQDVLTSSGIAPARLELEVSESALLADRGAMVNCLLDWKRMGVRLAVIHAGNDYSSLRYLSKTPIDRLKLDRALIARMGTNERDEGMVRALIALGLELDIDVIAEGVETEAQLQTLMQLRCPQVQGFLLGRPMPLVPVQIALRKPWGNLPKIPAFTSPAASVSPEPFSTGSASQSSAAPVPR